MPRHTKTYAGHCIVCGQTFDFEVAAGEGGQWRHLCERPSCLAMRKEAADRASRVHVTLITDADTGGGLYSGYNVGLDAVVENRGHYNRLVREKNLTQAG